MDGGVTLQKSILFTPLLPSAGPTGGDGLAWPAPTMSLTMRFFGCVRAAMVSVVWIQETGLWRERVTPGIGSCNSGAELKMFVVGSKVSIVIYRCAKIYKVASVTRVDREVREQA